MNIVLTGSLGHIGKPLADELIQKGHSVTVISSKTERQAEIEAIGAKAAIGSVEDTDFLTQVFTDADAVYCMFPPNFTHPDQILYYQNLGNIYKNAISNSGVKRVVHLSSYGAHLPSGTGFITGSHKIEQLLNAMPGIELTHIRPTFFYYNLFSYIQMIKTVGVIGTVYGGEDKLAMVSPKDIATVVAEELEITNNTKPIHYVSSDDCTCNDVAAILGEAIGKSDLKWVVLLKEQVLQSLINNEIPENVAYNLVELGEAIHTGKLREDYEKNIPAFGKVKIEDFAKDFAAAFSKS